MRRLAFLVIATAMLLCAASASAATGDLTFKDCLAKFANGPCGAVPNQVLDGGRDVAVSPDGSHVYVADFEDSIVWFNRSPTDGSLTYAGCIDNGSETGCTHLPVNTMQVPRSLAFSPDGSTLYAAVETTNDVIRFDVAANGALSFGNCVEDSDGFNSGCGAQVADLEKPLRVVVSPDGSSVYATSGPTSGHGAIHQFSANLTQVNCYREVTDIGCANKVAPIDVPYGMAISPDGKHLYVTSVGRDAITWFGRGSGGSLVEAGCTYDGDDTSEFTEGCVKDTGVNYDFMNHITFSPDGSDAYVTDETGLGRIYHFTRSALTGALTRQDCLADDLGVEETPGCTPLSNSTGSGLASVTDAVVSPDSANLYAVAFQDSALSTFSLDSSGAMSFVRCLRALEYQGCAGFGETLAGPFGVAISPDGHDLYVSNGTSNPAILHFERDAEGSREGGGEEPGGEEPGTGGGGGGSGGSGPGGGPGSTPPPSPKPGPGPKPTVKCGGFKATIVGTAKADTIKGTAKKDVIAAGGGNDKVSALAGNDVVCGEGGNDKLGGGAGADLLLGGPGKDTLKGNGGVDRLVGGPGRDTVTQ